LEVATSSKGPDFDIDELVSLRCLLTCSSDLTEDQRVSFEFGGITEKGVIGEPSSGLSCLLCPVEIVRVPIIRECKCLKTLGSKRNFQKEKEKKRKKKKKNEVQKETLVLRSLSDGCSGLLSFFQRGERVKQL